MQNTPILLLPGWKLPASRFHKLVEELKQKKYKVFAADFPGFAEGPPLTGSLTLDDYVEYIHRIIKKNNIPPAAIIGHSFGGRIAIRLSRQYPDTVKYLILTGVPGFPPVSSIKVQSFAAIAKTGKLVMKLPFLSPFEKFARKVIYKIAGANDYKNTDGYLRETFKSVVRQKLDDDMKYIKVPTLLLWGAEDTIVPVSIAARMKQTIPRSKLVILAGQTHKLPYENPKDTFKEIDAFLHHP